jgi:hypothetical protein
MDNPAEFDRESSVTAARMTIDNIIESIQTRTIIDEQKIYEYAVNLCQKVIRYYELQHNSNMLLREHNIQDGKCQLEMLNAAHNKYNAN